MLSLAFSDKKVKIVEIIEKKEIGNGRNVISGFF